MLPRDKELKYEEIQKKIKKKLNITKENIPFILAICVCLCYAIFVDQKAQNKMSYDTFECKTFSKRMGEDSEGENSEEDFDEMIMNINYFQKQNKSSEPSVVCDPLMLDPTNMNENTIMLIRRIEENISKNKVVEKSETKSDTYSLQQSNWQCNESASTSNKNSNKCVTVQREGKRENSQQLYVVHNERNEKSSVKRVCLRKEVNAKNRIKNVWSPGSAHALTSKETKNVSEKPSKIPVETIDNLQDPSVIEMNTNNLLRDIAKDIEEYKKRELTKPHNTHSMMTNNKNKIEASTLTKHSGESAQKMNEDQEKSKKKSGIETAKPKISTPNNSGIKCYHCDLRFPTFQLVFDHSKTVHQKINGMSEQKKPRKKQDIETTTSEIPTGINKDLKCKCNLNFKTTKLLKFHLKTANCKFDKFKCEICNKKYWYHHSLELHKDLKHGALDKFKCQICNKKFRQHIDLLSHKEVEHEDKTLLLNKIAIKIARTEAKYAKNLVENI